MVAGEGATTTTQCHGTLRRNSVVADHLWGSDEGLDLEGVLRHEGVWHGYRRLLHMGESVQGLWYVRHHVLWAGRHGLTIG